MRVITLIIALFCTVGAYAQKYKSSESEITFFSEATLEDIAATNEGGSSVFNAENGEIVFSIPISEFEFEKSLMKEHFNEKYMETEKYPKAIFKGKVTGYDDNGSGKQSVSAEGDMTIHGVTNHISVTGDLEKKGGNLDLGTVFKVKLEDYKVKIPQVLWQNIAEEVEVKVSFTYKGL